MEWRCVGVDVRSNCMVTCFVIKAITVQWWHKHLGVLGFITFVHVVSRCNIYQVVMVCHYTILIKWNVIVLIQFQFGG